MGNQEKKKRGKKARSRAARLAFWFLLIGALGVVGAGCGDSGGSSGKECESSEECGEGYWCNPATNRCEARDGDGGMGDDGDVDGEVDGEVLECENSGECTEATAPICDETSQECRGCEAGSGECATDYPDRPLCDGDSGACVACLTSVDDCTEATEPICDETSGSCRGCEEGASGDAECEAAYGGSGKRCSSGGECVECLSSVDDCAEVGAPICDETSQLCRDCDLDTECEARGEGLEACDNVRGECVECTDSALHCAGIYSPVCDDSTHECRECRSHDECDHKGGLCEFSTGKCVGSWSIVYVDCGAVSNGDGSEAFPRNDLGGGVTSVEYGAGPYVLVEGSCEPVVFMGTPEIYIYGKDGAEVASDGTMSLIDLDYDPGDAQGVVGIHGMTLRGEPGHSGNGVVCNGTSSVVPSLQLDNVIIDEAGHIGIEANYCNLAMTKSNVINVSQAGVVAYSSQVTMTGCSVVGSGGGGMEISDSDLTMKGCEVRQNTHGAVNFTNGNGVFWNNLVHQGGVNPPCWGGFSLEPGATHTVEFWNNTVVQEYPFGFPFLVDCSEPITLYNSVFAGPGELLANNCVPEYCYIEDGSGGGGKTGCIETGTPGFVGGGDFHLGATSPCIDQGTSAGMPAGLTVDIDGENRVQGAGVDMGADEAQ